MKKVDFNIRVVQEGRCYRASLLGVDGNPVADSPIMRRWDRCVTYLLNRLSSNWVEWKERITK